MILRFSSRFRQLETISSTTVQILQVVDRVTRFLAMSDNTLSTNTKDTCMDEFRRPSHLKWPGLAVESLYISYPLI